MLHVGFSLGGFIAASCATTNIQENIEKFAVTLDSPGIILNKMRENNLNKYKDK